MVDVTMDTVTSPASIAQPTPQELVLSGEWTARGLGNVQAQLPEIDVLPSAPGTPLSVDGSAVKALDSAGAWVLQALLCRMRKQGTEVQLRGLRAEFTTLLAAAEQQTDAQSAAAPATAMAPTSRLETLGRSTVAAGSQILALLGFVGESAVVFARSVANPSRFRWRPMLFNLRTAGFDALPIVGLLSFLLGIVVAYQSASQLRQYGANIFVVDLVGLSMLREFAPLITAIIIAGRSGSAYAAQIGTMAVTEEIDAMRTLGIAPFELLVLPKIVALLIALPLLTVFADILGVAGGMIMARTLLDVGFAEFLERFAQAVSVTTFLIGICKAPVFAGIIAVVGCYQGFQTKGGADSVGRQTTRSVVQSIFLVIVADALFSVAFSVLDL